MRGAMKANVQKFIRQDSKYKFLRKSKSNLTILEILLEGCFETDWSRYCVNRISGFSCSYWISSDDYVPLHISLPTTATTTAATTIADKSGRYTNNKTDDGMCYLNSVYNELYVPTILKLLIIVVVVTALILNLLSLFTLRKFALIYLPICHYFTYICVFEQIDCLVLSLDWFFSSFTNYKPLFIIQFISQSSCQMIPMIFSIIRQLVSGLFIGMSIDLWRFIQQPVLFLANYRSEWVKNVLILCTVLVCTINCQFFWTFDLNKGENKVLHGRMISNYMECEFSNTLPLNPIFTNYLWPIADHVLAEILPFFINVTAAILSLKSIRRKLSINYPINLGKVLINAPLVLQLNKTLVGFLLVNAFSNFLPRVVYFTVKALTSSSSTFTSKESYRRNNIPEMMQDDNYNATNVNRDSLLSESSSLSQSAVLQDSAMAVFFGNLFKYQTILIVLIRFVYFFCAMKEFRDFSIGQFRCSSILQSMTNSNTKEKLLTTSSSMEKENLVSTEKDKNCCYEQPMKEYQWNKTMTVEIYC